uniref:Small ribosomal subunit protein uS3m n=1 Tax=Taiwanofungus camphoratus TaxID=2696576 RepID=A0A4D6SSK4_TAICA|nr:ribosomal protein S3 [Taiwanofungus camphoratus]QCG69992.1 ribosomal protein S3 [Taiwanofungus camphoratus]UKQ56095.1 ribosomal protein S3 [Taiwanofungus camphoratus]WRO45195.1 ribosomal protein S3 [Taiwanofungus sp. YW-2023a]
MNTRNIKENKEIESNLDTINFIIPIQKMAEYFDNNSKNLQTVKELNTNTKSLNKKSLTANLLKLTKYSKNLNLLSSNIRDNNQIILNAKKNTIAPAKDAKEAIQQENKTFKSKAKTYYEKIDMLKFPREKKQTLINQNNNKKINQLDTSNIAGASGLDALNINNNSILKIEDISMNTTLSSYLKSLFKFNLDIARSQHINYYFNSTKKKLIKNISSILENSFFSMSSLISKPVFNITPDKVVIHLLFFLVSNKKFLYKSKIYSKFLALNSKKLELLCANLSNSLKKPVELNLVRLHHPFYDSDILANLLGRICDINFKPYIYILDNLFNKTNIINPTINIPEIDSFVPTFITGINIKLAGRLRKQKIIPRHTVKTTQHGSLTRSSADLVSKARFTTKNKRGTFSITATIGHRFFN